MNSDVIQERNAGEPAPVVSVSIFGQEYPVRADVDAGYLRDLAAELDRRMRKLHEAEPSRTPLKIAVMTALNMMDELRRLEREAEGIASNYEQRAKEMEDHLTRGLFD